MTTFDGAVRRDFTGSRALMRGDTWAIVDEDDAVAFEDGRSLLTAGVVLRCTIKTFIDDPDPGLVQLDTLTGGIVVLSEATFRAVVTDDVTDGFPIGHWHYDVTIDFSPVESYTLVYGVGETDADVTRAHL